MEQIVILFIIVALAALLQASTGYGFSIIGTPFLLLLFPAHTAIQINIILSICLSAVMILKIKSDVDKALLVKLIKGSVPGLFLGIFIYLFLDVQLLKTIVGILIVFLTLLLISKVTINRTYRRDFLTGGLSGLLTTSIGVPGPPLLLYFSGVRINKAILRSTTLAYYLFVYFISLIMQIFFGGTNKEVWTFALLAIPPLLIGIMLGQILFKWISQRIFRSITYGILMFTGIYLLIGSL